MIKTTNTYSSEMREPAIRMVLDNAERYKGRWSANLSIAGKTRAIVRGSPPLPLDDERATIILFIQYFTKNLWKNTVVDSGNIVP
ncbi:MAG: hypothetical protein ACFB2Z_07820 [Maricaulaceae bacterium]